MGEDICTPCKDKKNICDKVYNFSSDKKDEQNDLETDLEYKKDVNNKNNKNNKEIKNNNQKILNNEILYDNPLSNISLNESMNLGTCYIGTSKNSTKLKSYKPENLKTLMIKNRITLDTSNNSIYKFKESPLNRRLNLTTRNNNQKTIKYKNLLNNNYYLENKIKIPAIYNFKNEPQKKNNCKSNNDNKNIDNKKDEIVNYFINKFNNNKNFYNNYNNSFSNIKYNNKDNKLYTNENSTSFFKETNNSAVNHHNDFLNKYNNYIN
jgi:hypothetical protein